jgi:hypothetical protein
MVVVSFIGGGNQIPSLKKQQKTIWWWVGVNDS